MPLISKHRLKKSNLLLLGYPNRPAANPEPTTRNPEPTERNPEPTERNNGTNSETDNGIAVEENVPELIENGDNTEVNEPNMLQKIIHELDGMSNII